MSPSVITANDLKKQLSNDELNILLSKAEINFGRVKTIKTLLTQEKHISLFSEKIFSTGLCIFKAPDKLRLEFITPFKSVLIVDKNQVYKYEYYDEKWQKLTPGNKEIMLHIMKNISSWLKGKFNDVNIYDITANQGKKTSITLIPKHKDFRNFITSFELGLNENINALDYIIINEKKNDYTKIVFHNDIHDSEISDKIFSGKENKPQNVEKW